MMKEKKKLMIILKLNVVIGKKMVLVREMKLEVFFVV